MNHCLHVVLVIAVLAPPPPAQDVRELSPGVSLTRELSTGQVHTYQLLLARGDFLALAIEQQGIDVATTLRGPDGRDILTIDAMDDEFRPESVVAIAESPGTYVLMMRPAATGNVQGRYVIRLEPPRPASASDEMRVEAERAFARGRQRRDVNQADTWPAALTEFDAARERFQQLGDRAGEMKTLIEIAVTENYRSRAEAAAPVQQAERLARELDDRPALARALRVLASIYFLAGNLDAAAEAVEEATQINRAIGNHLAEFHSLNFTAIIYSRLGDVEKAIALYERAMPLARTTRDRAREATILNNLASAYSRLGEYEKARAAYEQSLAMSRATNDRRSQYAALGNLGSIHLKLGNPTRARELHLRALAMARSSSDAGWEARELNAIGLTYFEARDYANALEHQRLALAIGRRLGDASTQAWSLTAVGQTLRRMGRHAEAIAALREALAIHQKTRERFGERDALTYLARLEQDKGHLDEAIEYSRRSVDLDEATRAAITTPELRTTFVAAEQDKYELLIDLLQRRHQTNPGNDDDVAAALEISERARARALLDSLLEAHVDLREGIEPALLEREQSLQKQLNDASSALSRLFGSKGGDEALAAAAQKVDRLTAEYQQVQTLVRRDSPHYAAVTQPQPSSARDIQQSVLDEDTVLLEFALGDERSWLWAVTTHDITSVELVSRRRIEATARSLYRKYTARQRQRGESTAEYEKRLAGAEAGRVQTAAEMSRLLFAGIARRLTGEWRGKRLAIVATGALEYLPFAALPLPERTPAIPMIARHEIVTIPSASVLAMLRRETSDRAPAAGTLAIVADPVFDPSDPRIGGGRSLERTSSTSRGDSLGGLALARDGFARLPFSRDEAHAISSLAGPRQVFTALDFDASRSTVLGGALQRYRVVHFATHGIVDGRRPALSGLILSLFDERGKARNGYLRLHDIYNTRLDADLVVLSACQTALGKEIKGEGLVSLTRAFMYAGAPRVVASLWQVNDHATAELMTHFYRGILQQKLAPGAALRAAQRALARDPRWREPYYWAGFVLQGDWRP